MIYRLPKNSTHPFARIDRDLIHSDLSMPLKMTLITILSYPDDWQINGTHLARTLGVSESTCYKYLRELEHAGYIEKEQIRSEDGTFKGYCYHIYESPSVKNSHPVSEPSVKKPNTVKPSAVNQRLLTNKETNKSSEVREIFEYPDDLTFLKFYETQTGDSIELFVDQLRAEVERLGKERVEKKAKACKQGQSWEYLLKALGKLSQSEPEAPIIRSDQWQPSGYAQNGSGYQLERFDGDDGETIDLNGTIALSPAGKVPPEIQKCFELAKHQLKLQMPDAFAMWMKDMNLRDYSVESNALTIEVIDERVRRKLEAQFKRNIRRVLSDVLNKQVTISFVKGWRKIEGRQPIFGSLKTGQVAAYPA